jgi:hypothetical protein
MARIAQANPSTTQTNAAFIEARAGRVCVLERIYVSSDTALTISLVNSATHDLRFRQYVGATGGSSDNYYIESALGEGFDLTTSGNGNVFISAVYRYSDD